MEQLIEKFAMQCLSWPYWRDLPNDGSIPANFVTEWPSYVTEEQKTFWRNFVSMMVDDLKFAMSRELLLVNNTKLDAIIEKLNAGQGV